MQSPKLDDGLVWAYLLGNCTAEEVAFIEEAIESDPDFAEAVAHKRKLFGQVVKTGEEPVIESTLSSDEQVRIEQKPIWLWVYTLLLIALGLLLVLKIKYWN